MKNICKYEHIKAYSTEKYKSIEQNLLIKYYIIII